MDFVRQDFLLLLLPSIIFRCCPLIPLLTILRYACVCVCVLMFVQTLSVLRNFSSSASAHASDSSVAWKIEMSHLFKE